MIFKLHQIHAGFSLKMTLQICNNSIVLISNVKTLCDLSDLIDVCTDDLQNKYGLDTPWIL